MKQHDTTRVNYQIGIVSYGPKKCGKVYPGIYINVVQFMDWIENKIES
jgi:secreted trypsin-like serine protease